MKHEMLRCSVYEREEHYAAFSAVFKSVIDKHVPLKNYSEIIMLISKPKN